MYVLQPTSHPNYPLYGRASIGGVLVCASACQPKDGSSSLGWVGTVTSIIIHRPMLAGMDAGRNGQPGPRWRHLDYGAIYWVNLPVEARVR